MDSHRYSASGGRRADEVTVGPPWIARVARMALLVLGATLPIVALFDKASYQAIWQSARAFAALLPVAACWLLMRRAIHDVKQRRILFGCASMLAWASLVQFPFSAPIYFCYVTPLAVIAAASAASGAAGLHRPVVGAWTVALLMFALLSLNRGYAYNLGYEHYASYGMNVPLNLARADLQVTADEAETYRGVVELVDVHRGSGRLVAGPDCPEVYFLTGQFSPSGSMFDFFADDNAGEDGVTDLPEWATASVIVINHRRSFSGGLSGVCSSGSIRCSRTAKRRAGLK